MRFLCSCVTHCEALDTVFQCMVFLCISGIYEPSFYFYSMLRILDLHVVEILAPPSLASGCSAGYPGSACQRKLAPLLQCS